MLPVDFRFCHEANLPDCGHFRCHACLTFAENDEHVLIRRVMLILNSVCVYTGKWSKVNLLEFSD